MKWFSSDGSPKELHILGHNASFASQNEIEINQNYRFLRAKASQNDNFQKIEIWKTENQNENENRNETEQATWAAKRPRLSFLSFVFTLIFVKFEFQKRGSRDVSETRCSLDYRHWKGFRSTWPIAPGQNNRLNRMVLL